MNRSFKIIAPIFLITLMVFGGELVESQSAIVLFETDFSSVPNNLEITDDQLSFVEAEVVEETDGSILRICRGSQFLRQNGILHGKRFHSSCTEFFTVVAPILRKCQSYCTNPF